MAASDQGRTWGGGVAPGGSAQAWGDPAVVTPEAVILELPTAGLGSRLVAQAIDLVIRGALILVAALILGLASGAGGTPLVVIFYLVLFGVIVAFPIAWESLWKGRTPGKAAMGLRVVTSQGAPITFRHAAVRGMIGVVEDTVFLGLPAVVAMLFSKQSQRLGDLAAGTLVVRERTGAPAPVAFAFPVPPGCEAFVQSLDVSRLDNAVYGTVRSLLVRSPSLDPSARAALAAQVGRGVAARLQHTPPAWIHPEAYLLCVAVAYQRRTGGRGWGAAPQPDYGNGYHGPNPTYGYPAGPNPAYGPVPGAYPAPGGYPASSRPYGGYPSDAPAGGLGGPPTAAGPAQAYGAYPVDAGPGPANDSLDGSPPPLAPSSSPAFSPPE